jgi:Tol biopolymer transport system component
MSRMRIAAWGAVAAALVACAVATAAVTAPPANGTIAFFRGAESTAVESIGPAGARRRTLVYLSRHECASSADGCALRGLTWSPDGREVAFVQVYLDNWDTALLVADADGTNYRELLNCRGHRIACPYGPSWSPDSSRLVVAIGSDLYVVRPNGRTTLLARWGSNPSWSPDGARIAFERNGRLFIVALDGRRVREVPGTSRAYEPVWSPDGRTLLFRKDEATGTGLYTVEPSGANERLVVPPTPNPLRYPSWSPDGTRIVYSNIPGFDAAGGPPAAGEIWIARVDGRGRRRVYNETGTVAYEPKAVWSPDGRQLAVAADRGIYVVSTDGTNLRRLAAVHVRKDPNTAQVAWQTLTG